MRNCDAIELIKRTVAGGCSSSLRAAATPLPIVVRRSEGCRVWDVEDNELIDLNMGYGPHLFGYADAEVLDAVAAQFALGAMTGLPHEIDGQAGELISEMVPGIEQVRFANSGTEAVASSLRLARATTGRQIIVTFEGHYHGWSETVFRAGKKPHHFATHDVCSVLPGALGMVPGALASTRQVGWNDTTAVDELFACEGDKVAAVIVEPVLFNANVIPPAPGFLEHLREVTSRHGAILIFDEVITGFRVARGGAQERYGVEPDLTVVSKVMGGGFPVAAFGGRRPMMRMLADNVAHHAGVYAGNHTAIRAVMTVLTKIRRLPGLYDELEAVGAYAEQAVRTVLAETGELARVSRVGSIMSVALLREPLGESAGLREIVSAASFDRHVELQKQAQSDGVYMHPNPLEPWFLSLAHTPEVIDKVAATLKRALLAT